MPAEGMTATGPDGDILERASRALAQGRAEEALQLCHSASGSGRPLARLETLMALALAASGNRAKALKSAAKALKRPDCDAACLELLGGFYERMDDWEAAFGCFRRGNELAPQVGELWRRRAAAEAKLGRTEEATESLRKAIAAGSDSLITLNDLSTLYVQLTDYAKAAETVAEIIARQPRPKANQYAWLGKILLADGRPEEALPQFRRAMLMDPGLRDALSGQAICYGKLKKPGVAKKIADFLVRRHPLYKIESRGPAKARVLVFEQMASQMWQENRYGKQAYAMMNTIAGLPPQGLELRHIYVDHLSAKQLLRHCHECDVVFNNVCNGEMLVLHKDLRKLQEAVAEADVPIINHPDKVINSTRENNYNHFKNDSRFVFPKTRSYLVEENKLAKTCELIRTEFALPYILRTPTTHMGTSMVLIEKDEDLEAGLRKFIGRFIYVIKYHECRFRAGIYRKIRACFIGGDFHPIRIDFKADWNVHRFDDATKLMLEDASLRKNELAYIEDCEKYLGKEAMACLETIDDKLGLDFLGIDFGIGEDGRMVIFEANPAMNVLEYRRMKDFPYFEAGAQEVEKSFQKMLLSRADSRRIAPVPLG
ncbi:MAG: tetratricopeptide repeat protein [Rhodovibrionaceae bacterium]